MMNEKKNGDLFSKIGLEILFIMNNSIRPKLFR
jgi:hypothetical protein